MKPSSILAVFFALLLAGAAGAAELSQTHGGGPSGGGSDHGGSGGHSGGSGGHNTVDDHGDEHDHDTHSKRGPRWRGYGALGRGGPRGGHDVEHRIFGHPGEDHLPGEDHVPGGGHEDGSHEDDDHQEGQGTT